VSVTTEIGPSRWAIGRFGEHTEALWKLVPAAMGAAVERQMDAHAASRLSTLQAFGGAWPARYEELVERLKGLDGVEVVRPAGAAFQLAVVNGQVLVPFRYADDLSTSHREPRATKRLNKSVRELLTEYGTATEWVTDELFPITDAAPVPEAKLLRELRPGGIVLVFFAANAKAGLLSLGWGEATVVDGGQLGWGFTEMLPLPKPRPPVGGRPAPVHGPRVAASGGSPPPRFDDAPMVAPKITARHSPADAGGPIDTKAAEE
jgi:hypothetical protein